MKGFGHKKHSWRAVEIQAISHQPSAISHQPSAISHQPSAISHQPSAISHQPSAIRLYACSDALSIVP
jgi:hypothetical protein